MRYPKAIFYHSVVCGEAPASFYALKHPTVEQFDAHLDYLEGRFTFVSAAEFLALYEGRSRRHYSRPPCLLTFDDGHRLVLTNAVPRLDARGIPCVIFIVAGTVLDGTVPWYIAADYLVCAAEGREVVFRGRRVDCSTFEGYSALKEAFKAEFIAARSEDERQALFEDLARAVGRPFPALADLPEEMAFVSAEEIRDMSRRELITVASHALTHRSLAALPEAEQERELSISREVLASLTGRTDMMVSYPDGSHDEVTRRLARQCYTFGFAVERAARRGDRYAYPRPCLGRMSVKGLAYWLSFRRKYVYSVVKRLVGRA